MYIIIRSFVLDGRTSSNGNAFVARFDLARSISIYNFCC